MASMTWLKTKRRWFVRWHVTVKNGPMIGRVIKGSKTFRKKEAATFFKAEIEKRQDYWAIGREQSPELISDALDKWYLSIRSFTKRTQYLYRLVAPKFIGSLPNTVRLVSQITPVHIRNYIDSLLANKRKGRTCNVHLTVIKSLCRYLSERYGVANPAAQVKKLKEVPPNHRFLNETEYRKALQVEDPLYCQWAQFIAHTGLRATEFCELTWVNISDNLSSLTIIGKGRKRRTIPLNSTCQQILQQLKSNTSNNSHPIFMSKSNKPLNRYQLRSKCLQTAKKAKIESFGPHSLRHYFATQLLLKGVRISLVSKLLGHSSIRITEQTYIHILPEHLTGLTDCLM